MHEMRYKRLWIYNDWYLLREVCMVLVVRSLLGLWSLRGLMGHGDLSGGRCEAAVVMATETARVLRIHSVDLARRYVWRMRMWMTKVRRGAEGRDRYVWTGCVCGPDGFVAEWQRNGNLVHFDHKRCRNGLVLSRLWRLLCILLLLLKDVGHKVPGTGWLLLLLLLLGLLGLEMGLLLLLLLLVLVRGVLLV